MNELNFPFVDAVYRPDTNEAYAGNPYAEALPLLPDDATLARQLTHLPKFDPGERNLPGPERILRLDTLQTVLIALPRLVRLARAIMKLMRTGYRGRKPFSKSDNLTMQELYALQQSGSFQSLRQIARAAQYSMALIGASGCGKSYSLRHIAGMFPPAIYHEKWGKWQLPFLFLEMSYDGESVHTLASELYQELDRLLPDAGYTELFMERKGGNAQQRLAKALALAHEHGVGMIVVDESQNQLSIGNEPKKSAAAKPKSETPLTKLLITASNVSHVPLLMAGTLEMQTLVGGRFTRARRMAGRGSSVWMPLESSGRLAEPAEFEMLMMGLWRYQWIRTPVPLTDAWVKIFFAHTQGIPDLLVKLFESSQETAISTGAETLTEEIVAKVNEAEFAATKLGVTAVATQDRTLLESVTDLWVPDMVETARNAGQQFPVPRTAFLPAKKVPASAASDVETRPAAPRKPRKLTSPTPVAVEFTLDAAARASLLSGGDAAHVSGVDLTNNPFPT